MPSHSQGSWNPARGRAARPRRPEEEVLCRNKVVDLSVQRKGNPPKLSEKTPLCKKPWVAVCNEKDDPSQQLLFLHGAAFSLFLAGLLEHRRWVRFEKGEREREGGRKASLCGTLAKRNFRSGREILGCGRRKLRTSTRSPGKVRGEGGTPKKTLSEVLWNLHKERDLT